MLYLYFYFSGLSLRRTSERLACFIRRNHVSIWNWIQKYKASKDIVKEKEHRRIFSRRNYHQKPALNTFGCGLLLIEPKNKKEILGISISNERNMFVAERFLSKIR